MHRLIATTLASLLIPLAAQALELEAKIPLGDISGRIDHLAFDASRERVYIAELGNDSIGIVDFKARRLIRTVSGFAEPQGIAYEPFTDTVFVANGGDGSVRFFSGENFKPLGSVSLGKDADNVRIDRTTHNVYVGYGDGAIAVIDAKTRRRIADVPLEGHPEGFQLIPGGEQIFVNVPDAHHIAIVSQHANQQIGKWPTQGLNANYPLAIDEASGRVLAAFRRPAHLQAYDMRSGAIVAGSEVCGDADDVFVDNSRRQIQVICGEGFIDTFDATASTLTRIGRIGTAAGSRTGLFIPEVDRLLVAIRASQGSAASVWVLRPSP
jgi:DNA-binding beta-propeller fold protein YncE